MSNTYNVAETFLCKQLPRCQSTKGVWGYSGTNSGGIRAVGFLPNNFRGDFFCFCSVDVLICAYVQMFALRAFVSLRFAIFFGLLLLRHIHLVCIHIFIYMYFCMHFLLFFCCCTPEFACARGTFFLIFCYLQQLPTSCAHQNGNCATCTKCD